MPTILDNALFTAFSEASEQVYIYVCDVKQDLSHWVHRGLPYRTVWSADADPEGVQHPGIPGNPGHLGAVRGAHGGDAV